MPSAHRRRGEQWRDAVFAAALAEISASGLRGASMDSIARRAETGKSSLYRRWPNVRDLALDVVITTMESRLPRVEVSSGSLRDDLVHSLTTLSTELDGDLGIVLRELISEGAHDPSLVHEFQTRFGIPKQAELMNLLQSGMARGDIPVAPVDPYVLQLPAAMVMHTMIMTGHCPSIAESEHIIDAIMMPLLRGAAPGGQSAGSLSSAHSSAGSDSPITSRTTA